MAHDCPGGGDREPSDIGAARPAAGVSLEPSETRLQLSEPRPKPGPFLLGYPLHPQFPALESQLRAGGIRSPEKPGMTNAEQGPGPPGEKQVKKTITFVPIWGWSRENDPETGLGHIREDTAP